jgi:DNA processing protein
MVMDGLKLSREVLIAMHETLGIGWKTIERLWEISPKDMIRPGVTAAELQSLGLAPKAAAALAANLAPERIEESRLRRIRAGIEAVTCADPEYPGILLRIGDPPAVLYCIGRLDLLQRPVIGVVGTRGSTSYGRHVAEEFSEAFSHGGLTVASGLARGIDTAAHRGALRGPGSTIAVLGLPVNQIYPPENRALYREIAEKGLLISEAPPGTQYHRGMFPSRNRIISGLSLGVVIAEAPEGSGALITANYAISQERPVFAVPGPVTSPRSRGCLQLLREGTAEPLISPEDILTRFAAEMKSRGDHSAAVYARPGAESELTDEEARIYELLLDHPCTADELMAQTGLPFGQLHALLLGMQMKRKVRLRPGAVFEAV